MKTKPVAFKAVLFLCVACVPAWAQQTDPAFGNHDRIVERVQECSGRLQAYCSDLPKCIPGYAVACNGINPAAYYNNCVQTIEQNMFDPVDRLNDLRMTLSPPNGNLYQFVYGMNKSTWYLPVQPTLAEPLLACLLNGDKKKRVPKDNPCDEPPDYTLTSTYDGDTNYCSYQLRNNSVYQEQCWIAGNELGPFPGGTGGWSLPGACTNVEVKCRVWPTNPNGYAYNNHICVSRSAQHQDSPAVPNNKQTTKAKDAVNSSTLLVTCDLACNWKLDGEAKGTIAAQGFGKARSELGQHVLAATTLDGVDRFQQDVELTQAGQTVVHIEFATARATRLAAEQKAKDDAARAEQVRQQQEQQRAQAAQARQAQLRQQQLFDEQELRRHEEREAAAKVPWVDPSGLMWTRRDNGYDIDWLSATSYCNNLQYAGLPGWRLPTVEELRAINDESESHFVKGDLQRSKSYTWVWSGTKKGMGHARTFWFGNNPEADYKYRFSDNGRALCVHPAQ
jgi:Protein of unknown function (DUF1566)